MSPKRLLCFERPFGARPAGQVHFVKGAEKGDALAANGLGYLNFHGLGMPRNIEAAQRSAQVTWQWFACFGCSESGKGSGAKVAREGHAVAERCSGAATFRNPGS